VTFAIVAIDHIKLRRLRRSIVRAGGRSKPRRDPYARPRAPCQQ